MQYHRFSSRFEFPGSLRAPSFDGSDDADSSGNIFVACVGQINVPLFHQGVASNSVFPEVALDTSQSVLANQGYL